MNAEPSITTGDFPHDAVQAENGTIFVGDEGGDTITVIRDGKVTATLDAPEQPGGVATSGGVLAVVSVAAREISFFDTETLEQLAVLDAGAGPSHVVAGDDGRFYVADTGGDAILVYDGEPEDGGEPRLLDRTNVPYSPYGLAVDSVPRTPIRDPNSPQSRSPARVDRVGAQVHRHLRDRAAAEHGRRRRAERRP